MTSATAVESSAKTQAANERAAGTTITVAELAMDHFLLRLRPINRALRTAAAIRTKLEARVESRDFRALCVTSEAVEHLLDDVDTLVDGYVPNAEGGTLTAGECAVEERYREKARELGGELPLDRLRLVTGLTDFETRVLVLCAAPELDSRYERIIAYVLDDLNRRWPCVELAWNLFSVDTASERLDRRRRLGPYGILRRSGLLETAGEDECDLRRTLRPGPGVVDFLLGSMPGAVELWRDPDAIELAAGALEGSAVPGLEEIGEAFASGAVAVVGLWGEHEGTSEDAIGWLTRRAGRCLHRFSLRFRKAEADAIRSHVHDSVRAASAAGSVLLLETEALRDPSLRSIAAEIVDALASCDVPALLVGRVPWRPSRLLAARSYVELQIQPPPYAARSAMWERALPELERDRRNRWASILCLSSRELDSVASLARNQALVRAADTGGEANVNDTLADACASIVAGSGGQFASVVRPRRGPEDLVLPPDLHQQVIEIAAFARVMPRVSESWGFGRLGGGSGVKGMFTGDPGTGKTLAAEVIAGILEVPLLKVDISETMSKWVGETEKNLEEVFRVARSSRAVLFFDEADALFGKRGEVRSGVDRFANTEVSHLLQRLEEYDGLVLLATNLKDNIDPAFTRRFHVIVHFPRPSPENRASIWRLAFPIEAPLDGGVDLETLANLDLTGAGICGAARSAALLAAAEGVEFIEMRHVVQGIARQYQRESRVLVASEFGAHAALLGEADGCRR